MGNRIARARISAGFRSQQELAEALGLSRTLIGQWESQIKLPGRDNLAKIAKLCGVTIEYLQGKDLPETH
jgi:transcriptional regulator with XRE-family HTH domain